MPDIPRDPAAPETVVLRRYLDEACTDAERVCVEQWMAANPVANEAQLGVLRGIIRGIASVEPGRFHLRDARQRVLDRIAATEALPSVRPRTTVRPSPTDPDPAASRSVVPKAWPRGVGGGGGWRVAIPAVGARAARPQSLIATMVVVVLGVGFAVGSLRHRASVAPPGHEYATMAGQRLSVMLVDGTQVTLAPASRVQVAADYGQGTAGREVALEGEAYFAVAHDAAHPFVVRAHGAVASDVGTAFDMRAYPEDAGAKIAVAEGAVAVATARGCRVGPCAAEVHAGDVATVRDGGVAVEHGVDVAALVGWTAGQLTFDGARLRDVVRELDRWYDLEITLDSVLASRQLKLTAGDRPAVEVLDEIALLADARYERVGRRVTFIRRREPSLRDTGT